MCTNALRDHNLGIALVARDALVQHWMRAVPVSMVGAAAEAAGILRHLSLHIGLVCNRVGATELFVCPTFGEQRIHQGLLLAGTTVAGVG